MKVKSLSPVGLFVTVCTVAYQAPPSIGFSRQEYESGLPFPSPGDLRNPGTESRSPAMKADDLLSEPLWKSYNKNSLPKKVLLFSLHHLPMKLSHLCYVETEASLRE